MRYEAIFPDDTSDKRELARAVLAEFMAMTMFVFMGCGSVAATGEFLVDDSDLTVMSSVARILPIATTFGLSIIVLAFSIGPISGGHINPVVTLALLIHRRISPTRTLLYWAAQFTGATFGALWLWAGLSGASYNFHDPGSASIPKNFTVGTDVVPGVGRPPFFLGANALNPVLSSFNGLVLEIFGTSILVFTVFSTAVDKRSLGAYSALAPVPIGLSVFVVHLVLIPWTGCGINPARSFGPWVVDSLGGKDMWKPGVWIYYFGPAIGSTGASFFMFFLWGGRNPPGEANHPADVAEEEQGLGDEEASPTTNKKKPATTTKPKSRQIAQEEDENGIQDNNDGTFGI